MRHMKCTDQKWIGAPDPADHLKNHLGDDTCSDHVARWTIGAAVEPWPARNRSSRTLPNWASSPTSPGAVRRRSSRRGGFYPGFHRRFSHTHARLPAKQIARSTRS
eukprot:scaffold24569_cov57-Phaeocystis_antarctica.AAC.1